MKKIGIIILLSLLFALPVSANDISKQMNDELKSELSQFKESLPNSVQNFLGDELLEGDYNGLLGENLKEKSFLELANAYLLSGLNTVLKSFASILALVVILAIFNSLASSSSDTLKNIFSLCSSLCVSLTVFKICISLAENTSAFMSLLCSVSSAFLPIIISVLTLGGNISSAVVTNSSMLLFINLVESFMLRFLLPIVNISLAFSCIKPLNQACDISGIAKIVRTVFTSVTVFVMSIFMFVLSYKSILSQSVDSISIKTARFAISSFVPLVGSTVNDALRTLSSSITLIKGTCGVVAIIAIAVMSLPIIINLFLNKLSFSFLAIISGAIGGQGEKSILEDADSICTFLLTLCACTSVLFILGITIFIKTGVAIGG